MNMESPSLSNNFKYLQCSRHWMRSRPFLLSIVNGHIYSHIEILFWHRDLQSALEIQRRSSKFFLKKSGQPLLRKQHLWKVFKRHKILRENMSWKYIFQEKWILWSKTTKYEKIWQCQRMLVGRKLLRFQEK